MVCDVASSLFTRLKHFEEKREFVVQKVEEAWLEHYRREKDSY